MCYWKKAMNVGIYLGSGLSDPRSGGGFTVQHSLLNELCKNSLKHNFYIFYEGNNTRYVNASSVTFVPLSQFYKQPSARLAERTYWKVRRFFERKSAQKKYGSLLKKAVSEHEIDVMWYMTPGRVEVDIPYIYTVWDLQHRLQPYFPEVSAEGTFEQREKGYLKTISQAAYVIVGNKIAQQEVEFFYRVPSNRIKIMPLPTPNFALKKWETTLYVLQKYNLRQPYFFYPAQFWPHKNHIVILHALKELHEVSSKPLHVVFTGSDKGNEDYIKKLTHTLGLEKYVHFLGFISIEDVIMLYKNAQALIFASYFGPDNIPPLEACGLGCPVITAQVAGSEEQLVDAALYFDPKKSKELVVQINKLMGDEQLRDLLIKKGYKRAHSWTSKHYLNAIVALIDEFEPIRRCWSSKEHYLHP